MTSRNYHPKRKNKAADVADVAARGTATIFATAATRVLRERYDWDEEAVNRFREELIEEAMTLAKTLNTINQAQSILAEAKAVKTAVGEGGV